MVGVDRDAATLEAARARTRAARLGNVEFRRGEIGEAGEVETLAEVVAGGGTVMVWPAVTAWCRGAK